MAGDPLLSQIYQFCSMATERNERTEEMTSAAPTPTHKQKSRPKGPKKVEYYVSIEKFNWACDLFNVPQTHKMEALEWASFFSSKATDGPKVAIQEIRRDRWG